MQKFFYGQSPKNFLLDEGHVRIPTEMKEVFLDFNVGTKGNQRGRKNFTARELPHPFS